MSVVVTSWEDGHAVRRVLEHDADPDGIVQVWEIEDPDALATWVADARGITRGMTFDEWLEYPSAGLPEPPPGEYVPGRLDLGIG